MVSYARRIRTLYVDTEDIDLVLVFGFLNKLPAFPSLRKLIFFEDMEGHGLLLFPSIFCRKSRGP